MNRDQQIMAEIKRTGRRIADMTDGDFRRVVLKTMTAKEKLSAAKSIGKSAARVARSLSLTVLDNRDEKCGENKCGRFYLLRKQKPACMGCGCSGDLLELKWRDPKASCPEKIWLPIP